MPCSLGFIKVGRPGFPQATHWLSFLGDFQNVMYKLKLAPHL